MKSQGGIKMIKKSVIKDLIDEIEAALDKYRYEKYYGLELDEETSQELFNECNYFFEHLKEDAEDLDATIDNIIEQANEPSDYEFDFAEDVKRHLDNLKIRG